MGSKIVRACAQVLVDLVHKALGPMALGLQCTKSTNLSAYALTIT